ncbi:MAG: hypothetical protein F6J93_37425 [Oscillatoria sp. SIO1A7]|nr:hypothetical protein [Oscillatoria sp. SIO1A7]
MGGIGEFPTLPTLPTLPSPFKGMFFVIALFDFVGGSQVFWGEAFQYNTFLL